MPGSLASHQVVASPKPSPHAFEMVHPLVPLDEMIAPYNAKLKTTAKTWGASIAWGMRVVASLHARHPTHEVDDLLLLAGEDYARPLRSALTEHGRPRPHEPLVGKQIGERLAWLKAELAAMPKQLPAPGPESIARARWFVGGERADGCSFCGARGGRLCSGPGAAICADCVQLCANIFSVDKEAA